ncbi:septation protein A [Parapedomonas caeni]|jgi:intracellular septation protein
MSSDHDPTVTVKDVSPRHAALPWIRFAVDFVPLILFFVVNGWLGIYWATGVFMAAMVGAIAAAKIWLREIPRMLWVNGAIVLVFGGLTLWLHNDLFIKIKPTVLYTAFAVILFYGLWSGRPVLKSVLEHAYPALTDHGWRLLTRNWGWFFLVMAAVNEVVWRSFSTDTWVAFKAWGVMPISFAFAMAQMPILTRHSQETDQQSTDGGATS